MDGKQKPLHTGCKDLKCESIGVIKFKDTLLCFGIAGNPKVEGDEIVFCGIQGDKVITNTCTPFEALVFSAGFSTIVIKWISDNIKTDDVKNALWRRFIGGEK